MDSVRDRIVALHGETSLRRSALRIRGGAGAFAWAMEGRGYKTALEIGTYRGASAAEMAQFCDKVITIDLKQGQLKIDFDRHAFWRSLGIESIELHLVSDDKEKAALIAGLDFQFAFVDGAHDERVNADFAMVKRCGNVLFHDYEPGGHVARLVDGLPAHQVQTRDIFALWSKNG